MTSPKANVSDLERCTCGDLSCKIPYGYCHCQCGRKTPISPVNTAKRRLFFGKPIKFIHGHNCRIRLPIENATPFKIDGVYCRLIPLTLGFWAIVDAADYGWLMELKWRAFRAGRSYYAVHAFMKNGSMIQLHMHDIICDPPKGKTADHVNRCGLDNRRKNLRPATPTQQQQNKIAKTGCTSIYKGVHRPRGRYRWFAGIRVNGKHVNLGTFSSEEEAARAYDGAAIKYFEEFARINFPLSDYV